MIYTAIDTFYITDEQLKTSPSRKDGIDVATETTLRIYGCGLIQESGILLNLYDFRSYVHLISLILVLWTIIFYVFITFRKLSFDVFKTAKVSSVVINYRVILGVCGSHSLLHCLFYFLIYAQTSSCYGDWPSPIPSLLLQEIIRVAASCVWLASKLEESPRKARQVVIVFHWMECRRENLPIEHLDTSSKRYGDLKADLIRTERHLLKEMGFICHVEHPHKFISNYLAILEIFPEPRQEAWNLANDWSLSNNLRTTLCVRFKGEVVACGVVYAAVGRFKVPLPENLPWWKVFDADKSGIDEVCRVLAHLYSLPKAQYALRL